MVMLRASLCFVLAAISIAAAPTNRLAFDSLPHARFEFTGPVGERIQANLDNWLLRVPGMLSDWAVMAAPDGLVVNWLDAGRCDAKPADGTPVTITSSDDAWRSGRTELRVESRAKNPFTLRVRIPAWAVTPKLLQDCLAAPPA